MLKNKILSFILFAITTFSASFIGGLVTVNFKEPWYSNLSKPQYNPPDWIFGPVWTLLYLFITIAIWNAWHKNTKNLNIVFLYFIHLFFNTTWSVVFFGFHNISLAILNLVVLIIFIVLLVPHLVWLYNNDFITVSYGLDSCLLYTSDAADE